MQAGHGGHAGACAACYCVLWNAAQGVMFISGRFLWLLVDGIEGKD